MIELALPAGTFQNAIAALTNGADAVYFGLKKFSARKGAGNLTINEFSKLRRFSLETNKKIYITINTLIKDEEIDELNSFLSIIDEIGCDGIIVQDLGVAYLIKQSYPNLSLHGSTQLAIHTIEGVNIAKEIGFDRVVLSRELSIEEIEHIAKNVSGIELKVFIHGAMCYGFSGLCSASYIKCSRSGNRGECAQVCRTWFTEGEERGYFFSLKDQEVDGNIIDKLKELGISSLKVEGRMKGNEYVASTASYYRDLIDGFEDKEKKELSNIAFSRKMGKGFFDYKSKYPLVSPAFSSHRGLLLSQIKDQDYSSITFTTEHPIKPYDGLMILSDEEDDLLKPIKFSAKDIYKDGNNYTVQFRERMDVVGLDIYKISSGSYKVKEANVDSFRKYQKPLDIKITLEDDKIIASSNRGEFEIPFIAEEAIKENDIIAHLEKIFSQSDDSKYTLNNLIFENNSSVKNPFFPLSVLKEFRRNFYEKLDSIRTDVVPLPEIEVKGSSITLPNRNLLVSKDGLPFNYDPIKIDDYSYLSFSPITFSEEEQFNDMKRIASNIDGKVAIGLNNISQLKFASMHPEYNYFIDIYLFLANRYSAVLLSSFFKGNLIGGYLWYEIQERDDEWPIKPSIITTFLPPLFISRSCFRKDSLGISCSECTKSNTYEIDQNGMKNKVLVKDCITYVLP